jgi:hypothetical protein
MFITRSKIAIRAARWSLAPAKFLASRYSAKAATTTLLPLPTGKYTDSRFSTSNATYWHFVFCPTAFEKLRNDGYNDRYGDVLRACPIREFGEQRALPLGGGKALEFGDLLFEFIELPL